MPTLSVIMPSYNEAATLPEILDRVRAVEIDKEIIVVDDGSTDATAEVLAAYDWPELKVIRQEPNQGKGVAVRAGLAAAAGEVVIIQDADLEYDPSDYVKLVEPILAGRCDVVYGNRWHQPVQPSYRRYLWGGRLVTAVANCLYGSRIHDEPTCYKVFRRSVLHPLVLRARGFEFCPEVTAKLLRMGCQIHELPIRYSPRGFEEGKKITWKDGLVAIAVLLLYRLVDKRTFIRLDWAEMISAGERQEKPIEGKCLVVLPTYNERENIARLVRKILAQPMEAEALVVDDDSPDGTGGVADGLAAKDARVHVMHRAGKLGLGTAYRDGFMWALARRYDFVITMDSDFSHDPRRLPALVRAAQAGDVGVGSRYVPGGGTRNWGLGRRANSRVANLLTRIILGLSVRDATSGFRCFRRSALRAMDVETMKSRGYSIMEEMSYRCARRGLRVREVPIVFVDRAAGESKISLREALDGFLMLLKLRLGG